MTSEPGTEKGLKWWLRYVVVPIIVALIGGVGITGIVIAVISNNTPGPTTTPIQTIILPTALPTLTLEATPEPTGELTATDTLTPTPVVTSTPTPIPTLTPIPTPTSTVRASPTRTPTATFTPMPEGLPDLTVRLPNAPRGFQARGTGELLEVDIIIMNLGTTDVIEGFDILIIAEDFDTESIHVANGLLAGATTTLTEKLSHLVIKCYNPECSIHVEVDPTNQIKESDEDNNTAERKDTPTQ